MPTSETKVSNIEANANILPLIKLGDTFCKIVSTVIFKTEAQSPITPSHNLALKNVVQKAAVIKNTNNPKNAVTSVFVVLRRPPNRTITHAP